MTCSHGAGAEGLEHLADVLHSKAKDHEVRKTLLSMPATARTAQKCPSNHTSGAGGGYLVRLDIAFHQPELHLLKPGSRSETLESLIIG